MAQATEHYQERPLVRWFAQQLERVLQDNDYKRGWQHMKPWEIQKRMAEELEEIVQVLSGTQDGNLIDECIDLAAFCAFMAYNLAHGRI